MRVARAYELMPKVLTHIFLSCVRRLCWIDPPYSISTYAQRIDFHVSTTPLVSIAVSNHDLMLLRVYCRTFLIEH